MMNSYDLNYMSRNPETKEASDSTYLLFGGEAHNPKGGAEDYLGSFTSLSSAKDYILEQVNNSTGVVEWWHIADQSTMNIVEAGTVFSIAPNKLN